MTLNEIMQNLASGEPIEVLTTDGGCYDPKEQQMPKEWMCYEVLSIYTGIDVSTKESYLCVEVAEIMGDNDVKNKR